MKFDWDPKKEQENLRIHGVGFYQAQEAFRDPKKIYLEDVKHSQKEPRLFCIGSDGQGILTVRFTIRGNTIRIIGAGYWRKTKLLYEKKNHLHG